jgi:hypothetical protein
MARLPSHSATSTGSTSERQYGRRPHEENGRRAPGAKAAKDGYIRMTDTKIVIEAYASARAAIAPPQS